MYLLFLLLYNCYISSVLYFQDIEYVFDTIGLRNRQEIDTDMIEMHTIDSNSSSSIAEIVNITSTTTTAEIHQTPSLPSPPQNSIIPTAPSPPTDMIPPSPPITRLSGPLKKYHTRKQAKLMELPSVENIEVREIFRVLTPQQVKTIRKINYAEKPTKLKRLN